MIEPITIVEVEQVGDAGLAVIFSNGTIGFYSAQQLASIGNVARHPAPERDRLWLAD